MRLPRLLRTTSFRLALLYALLFAGSVIVLGIFVYWTAVSALNQQIATHIETESRALRAEFQTGGLDRLIAVVHERTRSRMAAKLSYLVIGANGERLAGDLPIIPTHTGWLDIDAGENAAGEQTANGEWLRVLVVDLQNGLRLAIGNDLGQIEEVQEAILGALGSATGIVLILGIGGGIALSIGFLRRVDAVTHTAEAIIAGDLARRVPTRGTNDDFDRLAATLNRMLDRIATLLESLRQVSNDIAHDLRMPLARLRQRLESMRDRHLLDDKGEAELDAAIAEMDTILETFAALLRIAQIEAGTRRAGFGEVDLSDIFETVVDAFGASIEDAGKSLVARIETGITARGDRELLTQMLVNLVENAIRHTPSGTRIEVSLVQGQDGPVGVVADNGAGVPQEERDRIFRRFYRLERSRTSPGSGLGLSLVAAIAKLHEISIEMQDNKPGLRVQLTYRTSGLQ